MNRPRLVSVVVAALVVAIMGRLLVHGCTSGGAMGGAYRTCRCKGHEWVVADQMAVDGPRITMCFGWVTARTCHPFRDGPDVPCDSLVR